MGNEVTRKLSFEDVLPLVRISNQVFLEHARFPEMGGSAVRYIREHPGWQWGAFEDGEMVGFLLTEPQPERECVAVRLVGTAPSAQGRGVGGRLLAELERRARGEGYPLLSVGTPFAAGFYQKYGFELTKVHPKVLKEIIRGPVAPEAGVAVRTLDFDLAGEILERLEGAELRGKFLSAFLGGYRRDRGLAIAAVREGKVLGVAVGAVSEFYRDFVDVRFFQTFGDSLESLVRAVEHTVSTLGLRYVGYALAEDQVEAFEALGYVRAERDFFWTMYTLEKRLR